MKLTPQAFLPAFGLAGLAAASGPPSAPAVPAATALTVYSSGGAPLNYGGYSADGYALVRQERDIDFKTGANTIRFTDVAARIDPTTVGFASLTDPAGTQVIEQNFQYDLVNSAKLLEKYVDRAVTVEQARGDHVDSDSGILLSTQGGMVLRHADGSVRIVNAPTSISLPDLPGGLITRPTLVWDVNAQHGGAQRTRVTYQTRGVEWWADYNLTYSEGRDASTCRLDIGAWVSIVNESGAGYTDARLKLVAGDVHRALGARRLDKYAAGDMVMEARAAAAPAFSEKSFFEYHLYTLQHPTTLPDNSTKQIELFPAAHGVGCEKEYVYRDGLRDYYGSLYSDRGQDSTTHGKIDVLLSFRNAEKNGMGMPLPAGRMRVNKLDETDGALEFIGEDRIDHTPRDEDVKVGLGSAFDIVGERRSVDFSVDWKKNILTETIEVKLRNHKPQPVTVHVKETLYRWTNWTITWKNADFSKLNANNVDFPLRVAADGETTLRYTVRYTW